MSEQHLPLGPSCEADLDHHLATFVASLAQAGYARKTQRDKERLIAPFIQWIRATGISLCDIDDGEECIDTFLACPTRCRYNHRCALQAFIAYLREINVLPQHPKECRYLVKDFGTSKSPKSTRQRDNL